MNDQPSRTEEREIDFKFYLDAVATSSQRSRFVLTLLIVAIITSLAALRQEGDPGWQDARYTRVRDALKFLNDDLPNSEPMTAEAFQRLPHKNSLNYAERLLRYDQSDNDHTADRGIELVNKLRYIRAHDKSWLFREDIRFLPSKS
jgi:hypothetical protein